MRQFKMQILTKTRKKKHENCVLREMGLKFQNLTFNILCKIAIWNKQKWLNEGGADYIEEVAQVKRQPVCWSSLEKW